MISSQRDELFYSSLKDLNEFKTLLKKISNFDNLNLSNESQLLLTYLEENILTEKDYKKIQEIYFVKFDHMTSTLINLGDKDENFYKISHFFYQERYFSQNEKYRVEVFPSMDVRKKKILRALLKMFKVFFLMQPECLSYNTMLVMW